VSVLQSTHSEHSQRAGLNARVSLELSTHSPILMPQGTAILDADDMTYRKLVGNSLRIWCFRTRTDNTKEAENPLHASRHEDRAPIASCWEHGGQPRRGRGVFRVINLRSTLDRALVACYAKMHCLCPRYVPQCSTDIMDRLSCYWYLTE
jgi:hypothetical protein